MSYYMPTVLTNSVGLPEKMARLLSACSAVSYLIFSGLAVFSVESMGRRVLISLTVAQFICFLIITILLYFSEIDGSSNGQVYANASVAFFFLYYEAFGIGMLVFLGCIRLRLIPCRCGRRVRRLRLPLTGMYLNHCSV